jgi:hypothetical protein
LSEDVDLAASTATAQLERSSAAVGGFPGVGAGVLGAASDESLARESSGGHVSSDFGSVTSRLGGLATPEREPTPSENVRQGTTRMRHDHRLSLLSGLDEPLPSLDWHSDASDLAASF